MAARSKLADASTAELKRELERREKSKSKLLKKRDKIARQLADIDSQLARYGIEAPASASAAAKAPQRKRGPKKGAKKATRKAAKKAVNKASKKTAKSKPGRGPNTLSLSDTLEKVMTRGKTMSIKELSQAVNDAGYKSSSKQFNTIIAQTLSRDDRFKKVSRGQYTLA